MNPENSIITQKTSLKDVFKIYGADDVMKTEPVKRNIIIINNILKIVKSQEYSNLELQIKIDNAA